MVRPKKRETSPPCQATAVPVDHLRRAASTMGGDGEDAAAALTRVRRASVAPWLTCGLCGRIIRDATTVSECLHSFCRKCITQKFEEEDIGYCPMCNTNLGCSPLVKLRSDHGLRHICSLIFPVKKRKIVEISPLYPALASLHSPSHVPVVDDHSVKKTDVYLRAEPMNTEIDTELGEMVGIENSASPIKPCTLNLNRFRQHPTTTMIMQEANEVEEEIAPGHPVLNTSYRKSTPLILPPLGPTISGSVPSSEAQERGFEVEVDKENPCSPVIYDDGDGNEHQLDIEMTLTNPAVMPFGVGNTDVVSVRHKAVQYLARDREAGTDGNSADVVLAGKTSLTPAVHAGNSESAKHMCITGQEDAGDAAARMSVEHVHNHAVLHAMEGYDVVAAAGPSSGTGSFSTPAPYPVWGEDPFLYPYRMVDWLRTQRRMVHEEAGRVVNPLTDMADIALAAAEKALTLEQEDKSFQLRVRALEEREEAMKQREHAVAEAERKANEIHDEAVEKIRLVEDRVAEERNKAWEEAEARVELEIQNYVKRIDELQIELENAKWREKDAMMHASRAESALDKAEVAISEMVSKKCDDDFRLKKADRDLMIANNRAESAEKTVAELEVKLVTRGLQLTKTTDEMLETADNMCGIFRRMNRAIKAMGLDTISPPRGQTPLSSVVYAFNQLADKMENLRDMVRRIILSKLRQRDAV